MLTSLTNTYIYKIMNIFMLILKIHHLLSNLLEYIFLAQHKNPVSIKLQSTIIAIIMTRFREL
jgi:hypothetical protein